MKASAIRYNEKNGGGKPTERFLDDLCEIIVSETAKAGFITGSHRLTGTAIKIGMHMSSFRINTAKLGYNARVGRTSAYGWHGIQCSKGYKRTNVPTWEQREEFNHLVNDIFDRFGLVATIVSGNYTVRTRSGRVDDWNYGGDRGNGWSGDACHDIVSEKEARESLDSDRLEAEHHERMRMVRCERSLEKRTRPGLTFKTSNLSVVQGGVA
jgi:hypothetical protein